MQGATSASICPDQRSSPNEEAQNVATVLTRLAGVARIAERIAEQPLFWGGVATALAVKGGTRGQQAALRGSVCYLVAAFIANIVIKPLVYRRRPRGAGEGRITPYTSSFPSGHPASDSAFVFSVAKELPLLAVPLAAAATASHWSLIRSEKHHVSDVLAGGAIGLSVAYLVWKAWPSKTSPSQAAAG
jgi:membrane-associated phospholipid phosphatase